MKKTIFAAATALILTAAGASAQILTQFTFETTQPTTSGPFNAEVNNLANGGTATAAGSHAAAAAVYSSPAGQGSSHSFSSNNWAVGDYYQINLSNTLTTIPAGSFNVSFGAYSSTTGPGTFTFQYSLDNATYTTLGTYTNVASFATQSFNIGSIAGLYNSANPVYFRLTDSTATAVNGATVAATGTSRFDNFTVGNVPEPATYAWVVGGLGALALGMRRRSVA